MKQITTTLALGAATIAAPLAAAAAPVTFTTTLKSYPGPGAYAAYYVTDAAGAYLGSLWMAGGKAKYHKHLLGWFRATGGDPAQIDGITGASIGSGQSQTITLNLSDAIFDKGYILHIDTSVEDGADRPNDVAIELSSQNIGKPVPGKGYIKSFTFSK